MASSHENTFDAIADVAETLATTVGALHELDERVRNLERHVLRTIKRLHELRGSTTHRRSAMDYDEPLSLLEARVDKLERQLRKRRGPAPMRADDPGYPAAVERARKARLAKRIGGGRGSVSPAAYRRLRRS